MDRHNRNKAIIGALRSALYDFDRGRLSSVVNNVFDPGCAVHLANPFEDLDGPGGLLDQAFFPLADAVPDLERRDTIVIGGSVLGQDWVGCAGYYTGLFERPWLKIPPTGHQISLRFHEFYRMEEGRVIEMQALWDIPEVMMQAQAWPMAPSVGREWHVPGPATQDGIVAPPHDEEKATSSVKLVSDMLQRLSRFADGGVKAMALDQYWHPKMNWYGPSGIGTNRRIQGFRNWHQIPFLAAMPNRRGSGGKGALFGDGEYVGFTAWPGMTATITGDGWMGIAPAGQKITMRSLDFWRCEEGLIRENWVLVDLLDVYTQIGVDVFRRMEEFTHDRQR
ncbi:MAG: ester cyclase [Arenicellales bacterium]|nr:ester cyclase [Arenicellales bacterium]|tara:strand:- start:602 stop:1609 length:1008 start_codon:yes stop_codon:yes gene_type:complete